MWRWMGTVLFRGETADDGICTLLLKWQNIWSPFADKLQVLLLCSKLLKWTVLLSACKTGKLRMLWLAIQKAHAVRVWRLKANVVNIMDKCALYIKYIFLKAVLLVILKNAQVPSPLKYSRSQKLLALKAFICCLKAELEKIRFSWSQAVVSTMKMYTWTNLPAT